jgi:methylmalonyl-CoA/ethylmalonyl-CoA epimerase
MIPVDGLKFHHFGLAVRDPGQAIAFLKHLGYECGEPLFDPEQNVILRWCEKPGAPAIEIVAPTGTSGPLANILASHPSSFYHLCYEIDVGIKEMVDSMREHGLRIVTVVPPRPAVLFGGRNVSFHVVHAFGLIEILEPASYSRA